MKKVSVIIPCHNATEWMPKCFLSLVQQSIGIENLELIFVDDASDDEGRTWAMLEEFEHAYPESIIIIHLKENLRQGGARNTALTYASGEYLAFVDADDFVAENFLEEVYQRAVNTDADIVQFEYFYYTQQLGAVASGRKIQDESITVTSMESRRNFLMSEKITYGCWNKIYRRTLVETAGVKYAEHVIYEEPLFVYPLLFFGSKFEIMENAYYYYRQNNHGTMRNDMRQKQTLRMHAQVQLMLWKFMQQTEFFEDYREEIKLYFLHTYFYETILFAVQRGFSVSLEFYLELRNVVQAEVPDYQKSVYERIIPRQMELYRLPESDIAESDWQEYLKKISEDINGGKEK